MIAPHYLIASEYVKALAALKIWFLEFADTIVEALGREPARPAKFVGIEQLPKKVVVMPAEVGTVKAFIVRHCEPVV